MELYNIVRTSVATYPIGKLLLVTKDMIIRFMGDLDYIDQYKNILISSNGNTLRLKRCSRCCIDNRRCRQCRIS